MKHAAVRSRQFKNFIGGRLRFSGGALRISLLALVACAVLLPLYSLHRPSAANTTPEDPKKVGAVCSGTLRFWDGEGADENWSTAANWCDNTVPNSGQTAVFNGTSTKNCTIDAAGPQGANIDLSGFHINTGYTGVVTQGSGVSVTVGGNTYSQSTGTFVGTNGNITINGNFNLNGGFFTVGSGNIAFNANFNLSGTGTFTASTSTTSFRRNFSTFGGNFSTVNGNGGTVVFDGGDAAELSSSPVTFNNLTFNKNNGVFVAFTSGPIVVAGTLTLADGLVNNSPIQAEGNVSIASTFDGGSAGLTFTGTANQTYTNPIDPPNAPAPNLTNTWTINKAGGTVNLGSNLNLSNSSQTLVLTNGTITTGANTVNAGTRNVTRTNGYIIGNLQRSYTATGNKDFFVGTIDGTENRYSPVSANVTTLTQNPSSLTIAAKQGAHPNLNEAVSLDRYWTVTETGNLTANLTFNYLDPADINGNETDYRVAKIDSNVNFFSEAQIPINRITNRFTVNAVTDFATWTLAAPQMLISPANTNVQVQSMQTFVASGGVTPFVFSIVTNNSGAAPINPSTGEYTAGTVANVQDTVRATDAEGRFANAIVTVTPGAPHHLAFTQQPTNTNAGATITPAVHVAIKDQFNNTITTATDAISVAIGSNPGGATLSGTLTRNALSGVGTFDNLSLNRVATGYTLQATSGSLTSAISNSFNITRPIFFATNTNNSGAGSLRQAIIDANSLPGADTINFNIPGAAPFTITPTTVLPDITEGLTIDGTTQPGYAGSPVIELPGTSLSGSSSQGLAIRAPSTVKGLVINRFTGAGIRLYGPGNIIQGNYIGTNVAGSTAQANGKGIEVFSSNNLIGGTATASRNVISGNSQQGVLLGNFSNNTVQGNFIGTNASGTSGIPNGSGGIISASSNSAIGGEQTGAGNTIAFNSVDGVKLVGGTGVSIRGNAIHSNSRLGITLTGDVPLKNDPGDGDTGANNRQNYPVLNFVTTSGGNTTIQGTLNSTPSASFTLDFYSNPTCDSSGYGEGQTYLRSSHPSISTDASGITSFNVTLPEPTTIGHFITAAATDSHGNTSEFSECSVVVPSIVSISGHITANGNPLPGVPVQLSGGRTASKTTLSDGSYSFNNLPSGANYTVTTTRVNHDFSPPASPQPIGSRSYTNIVADVTDADFTATKVRYTIVGSLLATINGATLPISDVSMSLSGTVARITNGNTVYFFNELPSGSFVVTPSKDGYAFTPPSANVDITNSDQGVSFTATPSGPPIEGRIIFKSLSGIGSINANGTAYLSSLHPGSSGSSSGFSHISLSRDGRKIHFLGGNNSSLCSMPADGGNLIGDGSLCLVMPGVTIQSPSWSPDDTKVAFIKPGGDGLWVDGPGASVQVPIGTLSSSASNPTWLSNTRLTFSARDSGSVSKIYAVNADGSSLNQLTTISDSGLADRNPTASPDGTRIAFSRSSLSNIELWVMNADGTGQTQIAPIPTVNFSWSPDGTRIAFLDGDIGNRMVSVNSTNGGGLRVIRRGYLGLISWGPAYEFPTPAGSNVAVNASGARVTFASVVSPGVTTFTPIAPSSAGLPPNGFVIGNRAYEISTTAVYAAPLNVCLSPIGSTPTPAAFEATSLMHSEGGILVDRTVSRTFITKTICGEVTTLSPFVLAEQTTGTGFSPKTSLPSITGLVQDNNGNPLGDVLVQLTGTETRTTQTDAFGIFNFVNLTDAGNYNVQPKLSGYLFSEYSQDFIGLTGENTVVFTGTQSNFSISGRAVDENGDGVSGVEISLDGATTNFATTDKNGDYSFSNLPADDAYSLTAFKDGVGFTPVQQIIDPLTSDQTELNFLAGPACTFGASPSSQFFPMNGGSGSVNVTAGSACSWTALAGDPWIIIVSSDNGSGNGIVNFVLRENFTGSARQTTINISGQLLTIVQDGGLGDECGYSISPAFESYAATGGSGTINVTADGRCAWQAVSSALWVTITSASVGTGSSTVSYNVNTNPGPKGRAATITIGGKVFAVKQKAP